MKKPIQYTLPFSSDDIFIHCKDPSKKVVVLLEITAPHSVADPGEGPAPLIYRPNWGPKTAPPPPHLRYLSVDSLRSVKGACKISIHRQKNLL